MKKIISIILTVVLLFSLAFSAIPTSAAKPKDPSRAIAIVFDNSGSMYTNNKKAWCQATYAMEVFASMLNEGDTLLIYPMWPVTVEGKAYKKESSPLKITNKADAAKIRKIYTPEAGGTPIETIDYAAEGLSSISADKKYMVVLTDGDIFYLDGNPQSQNDTKKLLEERFNKYISDMGIMYLGIGADACEPKISSQDYTVKKVENSANIPATLTAMCNQIFGRDTLPKNHISGKKLDFDISMKKLIVFVQGENISNVKLKGDTGIVGKQTSSTSVKYSTEGTASYKSVPDESLQGMMVEYTDCSSGTYTLDYSGNATSVEVYYEPDADLDFIFTDAKGNQVDPDSLYEGEYKLSFGMKDAKTGELINSDLLGEPQYEGKYFINGKEETISFKGNSGEVPISLKMDDKFEANLTVTYLSGYTITKDSTDFGWPKGGITVAAKPAGDFELKISGGDDTYSLVDLEKGSPYEVKVYYKDKQLTGAELEKVKLDWDKDSSNAEIVKEFANDHYKLSLKHKDSSNPQNTALGKCAVTIKAEYAEQGSKAVKAQAKLTYEIKDNDEPLKIKLTAPDDYIVLSEIEDSKAVVAELLLNGEKMSEQEFETVKVSIECDIKHEVTKDAKNSRYLIKLLPTDGIGDGDYDVKVTAEYKDHIGRNVTATESVEITLSKYPLWVKWLFWILLILLIIFIIWRIMRIKVLPKKGNLVVKHECSMSFDGDDVTEDSAFDARISRGTLTVWSKYADTKVGVKMKVKPGKDSYLSKKNKKRSAEVLSSSVKVYGSENVNEASFDYSTIYEMNNETGKLERMPEDPSPFVLKNGSSIDFSGTMLNKPFSVNMPLNFRKK